jgi:hypothetical protein
MKKVIFLLFSSALLGGCIAAITPSVSNVPVDSSEIAKSQLLGEDCLTYFLLFGPFGDASIKNIIDKNPGKKITLIDHKVRNFLLVSQGCQMVYGY